MLTLTCSRARRGASFWFCSRADPRASTARLAGAARAIAVDIDPNARIAAAANARLNGLELETRGELPPDFDVLLAGDVLYDPANRDLLVGLCQAGKQVIVSDPLRYETPRPSGEPSASFEVRTLPDVDLPMDRAVVYELSADGEWSIPATW